MTASANVNGDKKVFLDGEWVPVAKFQKFKVGDTIRMPHYPTAKGFRVWKIEAEKLGGEKQEGTFQLRPLDVVENCQIEVPTIMLESHALIERV